MSNTPARSCPGCLQRRKNEVTGEYGRKRIAAGCLWTGGCRPLFSAVIVVWLARDLRTQREYRPFFLSLGIFLLNYIGLGISLWPWLVPFEITFQQAAAAPESQSLLLIGTVIMLPLVLTYTGYCYYIFRGKTSHEATY